MTHAEHNRVADEIAATLSDLMTAEIDVHLMTPSAVLNQVQTTYRTRTIEVAFASLTKEIE